MHLETGSNELNQVEKGISGILKALETSKEPLSEYEIGQADGLRWALDIIREIKSPED
jgi:hypothetical protein